MTLPKPDLLERAPLAYENPDFLNSPDGRLLRIMAEYSEPMARFQKQRIQDTVVFFGSARFSGGDGPMSKYYEDARTLAGMLTTWAKALPGRHHRFVVTSGGGPGIMEAANRGAYEAGGKTIGLNIKLPHEQHPNPYVSPELNFEFRYFFMRKFWFAYMAKALVVFPGGFGTLDEMFEIVTLAQTEKLAKNITIIIYGSDYWTSVLNIDALIERGAVSAKDRGLFQFADTPEEAFRLLQAGLAHEIKATPHHEALLEKQVPAPTSQELLGPDIAKTRG
ncbi:TIGR00730 family Rossman fold protein [Granulicella arctica]|uniref:Cytokinin riboside 5'-monophosphate phosphoribohydrolase n=1 Tax=Granulicella arctica TaxID=940613 RepID=A0A7Y9PFQ7_9BACT|nr:TIGR00730 family Rossman fold protein [Granulicella arctica]NYF78306.1 hypothetical protein [Granulicella arctica]